MTTKIYIPNQGCHDFTDAEQYGTVIPMTSGHFSLLSTGKMYRIFDKHLSRSTSEDYILVCGPSVMNAIAAGIFATKHNCLNLLLYHVGKDGKGRYRRRNINLNKIRRSTDE